MWGIKLTEISTSTTFILWHFSISFTVFDLRFLTGLSQNFSKFFFHRVIHWKTCNFWKFIAPLFIGLESSTRSQIVVNRLVNIFYLKKNPISVAILELWFFKCDDKKFLSKIGNFNTLRPCCHLMSRDIEKFHRIKVVEQAILSKKH